jgi:hypothetical protein
LHESDVAVEVGRVFLCHLASAWKRRHDNKVVPRAALSEWCLQEYTPLIRVPVQGRTRNLSRLRPEFGRPTVVLRAPQGDDADGELGLQSQPVTGAAVEQFAECMLASGANDNRLGPHLHGHIREHDGGCPPCTRDPHSTPAALRGSQNSVITRSCRSALV